MASSSTSSSWWKSLLSFLPFVAFSSSKGDASESGLVSPDLEKATKEAVVKHPGDLSPFLDAREIASNHFTRLNRKAFRSQVLNCLQGLASIILASGLVALALDSRTEMYETKVDMRTDEVVSVSKANVIEGDPDVLKTRAILREFVRGIRTVFADRRATIQSVNEAYKYLVDGSPAHNFLNDYYRRTGEYPVQEVGALGRSVETISLNKQPDTNTWKLRWVERQLSGESSRKRVFEGTISLRDRLPRDEVPDEQLRKNPFQVYIVGLSFHSISQDLLSPSEP